MATDHVLVLSLKFRARELSFEEMTNELLGESVDGINLEASTLRELLRGRLTLLVFLRHFGCVFCREIVSDLRRLSESEPRLSNILFFFNDTVEEGNKFFAEFWPEARAVADGERRFYDAFGLSRGSVISVMLDPRIWARGIEALGKRNGIGIPRGDTLTLPGFFLVRENVIVASYRSRYSADHPDFRTFISMHSV